MIFIDTPIQLRLGDLTAVLGGWYAGDAPCTSISVRAGDAEFSCRLEDRADVQQAHPDLFARGFRCVLDFLAPGAAICDSALELDVLPDPGVSERVRIPAEPGWAEDIRTLRASSALYTSAAELGLGLSSGDPHYRAYVSVPADYDLTASSTFSLLTLLGLRQHHRLVDVGCGSLRTGRLLIPYLNPGNYLGVEPNEWLVREGISHELGQGIFAAKQPRFLFTAAPAVLAGEPPSHFALANSIFSHAALSQIRDWLEHLAPHLTSYGALVATFVAGDQDHAGQEWVYPACIRYRTETMRALAAGCGFRFAVLDYRHLHGQTWALFAKPRFDMDWIERTPLAWNSKVDAARF
jgi:hypothetical protein